MIVKLYTVTFQIETEIDEEEINKIIACALNTMPEVPYLDYLNLSVMFEGEEDE